MVNDVIRRQDAKNAYCWNFCHPGVFCPDGYCREVNEAFDAIPSAQPEKVCIAKITLSDEQLREAVEKAKNEITQVLLSEQQWNPCSERLHEKSCLRCVFSEPTPAGIRECKNLNSSLFGRESTEELWCSNFTEAADVPDINVGDMISRQDAIDCFWDKERCFRDALDVIKDIRQLPSAQPETIPKKHSRVNGFWCECEHYLGEAGQANYCSYCGRKVNWDAWFNQEGEQS